MREMSCRCASSYEKNTYFSKFVKHSTNNKQRQSLSDSHVGKTVHLPQKFILEKPSASVHAEPVSVEKFPDTGPYRDAETEKLKELVEQRDNEISGLLGNWTNLHTTFKQFVLSLFSHFCLCFSIK